MKKRRRDAAGPVSGQGSALLPASLAQKYIRIKRIKRNGARVQRDDRLAEGIACSYTSTTNFFDRPRADNAYLTVTSPRLHIVYEDENILLVDKQPGLAVHPHDGAEYGKTLIDHIQDYLYAKGAWRPRESTFVPALCNRIDRNTGGIVIAAKNAEALRILNQKVKDRELDKRYLAVIHGTMIPPQGTLRGQIFKDAVQKPGLRHSKASARLQNRPDQLPDASVPKRPVPGGVRAGNRTDPSDPRPVCSRRPSPSWATGSMASWKRTGPALSGPVRLPPDLPVHHRCRASFLPERPVFSGGEVSLPGNILPKMVLPLFRKIGQKMLRFFIDKGGISYIHISVCTQMRGVRHITTKEWGG